MMRMFCRGGAWSFALCLMVLAGCATPQQGANGVDGGESSSAVKTETGEAAGKAGQSQEEERQAAEPKVQTGAPSSGSSQMGSGDRVFAERIDFYREKKLEWDDTAGRAKGAGADNVLPEAWNECAQAIESALSGYQQLQSGQEGLNPWEVVRRDLDYFAKGCDQVFVRAQGTAPSPAGTATAMALDPAAGQLRQFFEAGHYQEAVTAYEALNKAQEGGSGAAGQGTQPSREAKTYYGRSLVKLGRIHEAALVLTDLLQGIGPTTDVAALESRVLTGDVLLADGQVDAARQVYEGVATSLRPLVDQQAWAAAQAQAFSEQVNDDDLGLYRELMQAYLSFDGRRVPQALVDGVGRLQARTASPLVDLARMLQTRAMAQSQAWARTKLTEARALLEGHDLVGARELMEELAEAAPEEMKPAIAQLQTDIIQAEVAALEGPKVVEGQAPASPWEAALQLFEQQKYDDAIAAFQKLVDGEHGAEAKTKIAEATELAAAAMRQQAAALYAKARKTFDPEAKRQALLSSRALLQDLIAKYPQSSVVGKARQNLKVLDTELGQPAADAASPVPPAPAVPAGKPAL